VTTYGRPSALASSPDPAWPGQRRAPDHKPVRCRGDRCGARGYGCRDRRGSRLARRDDLVRDLRQPVKIHTLSVVPFVCVWARSFGSVSGQAAKSSRPLFRQYPPARGRVKAILWATSAQYSVLLLARIKDSPRPRPRLFCNVLIRSSGVFTAWPPSGPSVRGLRASPVSRACALPPR
jgi:hypothetical protein